MKKKKQSCDSLARWSVFLVLQGVQALLVLQPHCWLAFFINTWSDNRHHNYKLEASALHNSSSKVAARWSPISLFTRKQ